MFDVVSCFAVTAFQPHPRGGQIYLAEYGHALSVKTILFLEHPFHFFQDPFILLLHQIVMGIFVSKLHVRTVPITFLCEPIKKQVQRRFYEIFNNRALFNDNPSMRAVAKICEHLSTSTKQTLTLFLRTK